MREAVIPKYITNYPKGEHIPPLPIVKGCNPRGWPSSARFFPSKGRGHTKIMVADDYSLFNFYKWMRTNVNHYKAYVLLTKAVAIKSRADRQLWDLEEDSIKKMDDHEFLWIHAPIYRTIVNEAARRRATTMHRQLKNVPLPPLNQLSLPL